MCGPSKYPDPSLPMTLWCYYYWQGADLKNHLDYLGEAYMYFLEGDDEADTALGEDYASAHKAEGASTVQRTTELEQTNERIVQEVQEVWYFFLTLYSQGNDMLQFLSSCSWLEKIRILLGGEI